MEVKLKEGMQVAVVAGFQGIGSDGRITTLGRGGSDTTAVALAAAFGATRCDIFTDVDGIYTTDPRVCEKARKLEKISYEEMLELASLGAKVLQTRSVELATIYKVRLRVRSSFSGNKNNGTLVCSEGEIMENKVIAGVAFSKNEAKLTLTGIDDRPGIAANIFGPLAEIGVNVDMIVQNISENGRTDMTFSCPTDQVLRAEKALQAASKNNKLKFKKLLVDEEIAKLSIVGIGMKTHAGIALKMFQALAAESINILVISTSEIKISVLINRKYLELAVQTLHDTFELEKT
jgi:aspartate kinase